MEQQEIDNFLNKNLSLIQRCMPSFDASHGTSEEKLMRLQEIIWQISNQDPLMKKLGKENFFSLGTKQKLHIIESLLNLMELLEQSKGDR